MAYLYKYTVRCDFFYFIYLLLFIWIFSDSTSFDVFDQDLFFNALSVFILSFFMGLSCLFDYRCKKISFLKFCMLFTTTIVFLSLLVCLLYFNSIFLHTHELVNLVFFPVLLQRYLYIL